MKTALTTPRLALLLVAVWTASTLINALRENWPAAVASLAAALAFIEIHWLRADAKLKPNQAIVTAAIEPSSDMRQAARAMTEIRA